MRVLHMIDSLSPGGTERQCVELVRGLARRGVTTAVVAFRGGALLADLEQAGIECREIHVGSFKAPRFALGVARLALAIRRWTPDVVQTYGFYSDVPGMM